MSQKNVCNFFNTPAGCRRGVSCKWRHERSSASSTSRTPTPTPTPSTPAPNGVCRFFWNHGNCRFTDCRFKHVRHGDSASSTSPPAPSPVQPTPAHGSTATTTHSPALTAPLKPGGARYHLSKVFLLPNFKFANPATINRFVNILASCSIANEWTEHVDHIAHRQTKEDSNELLRLVAEEHGLLRMQEVISHEGLTTLPFDPAKVSFQGCYIHILMYLTSDLVLTSSLQSNINALYGIIHQQYDAIERNLEACLGEIIDSRQIPAVSRNAVRVVNIPDIFGTVIGLLNEYLTRYKSAVREHSSISQLVNHIKQWFETWSASSHRFEDGWAPETDQARKHAVSALRRDLDRVCDIVARESATVHHRYQSTTRRTDGAGQQLALLATYLPPGHLRPTGPRHDNDHADILRISVEPSQAELVCIHAPYLPAIVATAPHHLRTDSMERLLDIQFRLLREELLAPLKAAVGHIKNDLEETRKQTMLASIVTKQGGRYRGQLDYNDTVMFSVYTNVRFGNITTDRRGLASTLVFDTPPGAARNAAASQRVAFWERMGSKRLMPGGLVALVWRTPRSTSIYLGIVASPAKDLVASARASAKDLTIRVAFFDPAVEVRILEWYQRDGSTLNETRVLVEAPVMYEAVRPFLEALKAEPTSIPFSKYLVLREGSLSSIPVDPPQYTTSPRFEWDLSPLLPEGPALRLDVKVPASVTNAREILRNQSTLDPSQAEAIVDSLTREVSLIQGPPGTGKSYIATRLLQVLIKNNIDRIIMIAFTNHALDHLLGNVLDAGITNKIARLGSRSADERIAAYSLEAMERTSGNRMHGRNIFQIRRDMRDIEDEFAGVVATLNGSTVDSEGLLMWLDLHHPGQSQELTNPPKWVELLQSERRDWKTAASGRKGKQAKKTTGFNQTEYGCWVNGLDLEFLEPPVFEGERAQGQRGTSENRFAVLGADGDGDDPDDSLSEEADHPKILLDWFTTHGFTDIPEPPTTDRSLDILKHDDDVWDMSRSERMKLSQYWESSARSFGFESDVEVFKDLKRKHADLQRQLDAYNTEARLQLLTHLDIIGCTTTGAAKLTGLLKSLRPTVMLVEEAGQVLEAHILGSLVPSVQHLIMIGDPLQLRPTINNYPFSMDHPTGKQIYRFDQSLMERLSSSGLSMSQLDVQRRMRPDISTLVRHTLYPNLRDNEHVLGYPPVRGIAHNVFFIDHSRPERGGGDDAVSKYNEYEVRMTKHIVLHLLRQGTYTKPKSIVVLCMYLGQLSKLREAFSACKITVTLDSRDQEALVDREGDKDAPSDSVTVQEVHLNRQVLLRTVDNYQGEEADIIVLSLVRNVTESGSRGGIGFLKSINRTNVALSRAKHGMIIMGNAELLSGRSEMWKTVIDDLREAKRLGPGLPISCFNHPEYVKYVAEPEIIPLVSPDGGCLRPCSKRLDCGHSCPSKCHADDHAALRCHERCRKVCPQGHPCHLECWESCGDCQWPIAEVELPCGHSQDSVPCHMSTRLDEVYCSVMVTRPLPDCEHSASMACSANPSQIRCTQVCDATRSCCSKRCPARCWECKELSKSPQLPLVGRVVRINHVHHPCGKDLFCQHTCRQSCAVGHSCDHCASECRQSCVHHRCERGCSTPCTPCAEPCPWSCPHQSCPVPCGSVCTRLPCDLRCPERLRCGHRCTSLCGEPCEDQFCIECASEEEKETEVDMILNTTIAELDMNSNELDSILIRLACGHIFTVETLDGICELQRFYSSTTNGRWIGLSPAPSGSAAVPPTCPTCRGSITARRYGRVYKRANLDMLERTVATQMSKALNELGRRVTVLQVEGLRNAVCAIPIPEEAKPLAPQEKKRIQRRREDNFKKELPLDPQCLRRLNMHGMPRNENHEWGRSLKELLDVYDAVSEVAATRSAHMTAYHAAISMLYDQQFQRVLAYPRASSHPEGSAIAMAKRLIGTSPPNADKRFRVEAIWLSMELRYILGSIILARLERIKSHTQGIDDHRLNLWSDFAELVFVSCTDDAKLAANITTESGAAVQSLEATIRSCRATLELTKARCSIAEAKGRFSEEREYWFSEANQLKAKAELDGQKARQDFLRKRGQNQAIDEKLTIPLTALLEKWEELITSLSQTTFYSAPPSREEMAAIIRVFGDTHRGHWYTCPNGHIFYIGECGGAMQTSQCNECGERIGGGGHSLLATNRPATLMEGIAQEQGQAASPWNWGRGV